MRIFNDFKEAKSEVMRDLKEMGIYIHPQTMQNKNIATDENYATHELQNYIYTVVNPVTTDLNPIQPWADEEFLERIYPYTNGNPGKAYLLRPDVWVPLLNKAGKFDYTYGQRMAGHLNMIIQELIIHPESRQLYLSIWEPLDVYNLGKLRVPCSLGYLFQKRNGKLNVTYYMRSCDIMTHYENDLYLCLKLTHYIASMTGLEVGTFTHSVASFHAYKKDLEGVF